MDKKSINKQITQNTTAIIIIACIGIVFFNTVLIIAFHYFRMLLLGW